MQKVIKKAHLEDFIRRQKQHEHTYIDDDGKNISGGEKQKIAIIRQVVQDGQVMIFDEPTSAMDESGKKQFLQLIDQIKNHKIIIIVSHDNAILNTCDEILIL